MGTYLIRFVSFRLFCERTLKHTETETYLSIREIRMSQQIFNAKFVAITVLIVVVAAAVVDNNHIMKISIKTI